MVQDHSADGGWSQVHCRDCQGGGLDCQCLNGHGRILRGISKSVLKILFCHPAWSGVSVILCAWRLKCGESIPTFVCVRAIHTVPVGVLPRGEEEAKPVSHATPRTCLEQEGRMCEVESAVIISCTTIRLPRSCQIRIPSRLGAQSCAYCDPTSPEGCQPQIWTPLWTRIGAKDFSTAVRGSKSTTCSELGSRLDFNFRAQKLREHSLERFSWLT